MLSFNLVSGLGTIAMGLIVKAPIIVAPGMGLNNFFVSTLIKSLKIPWQTALGYTLVHGVLLSLIAFFGLRKRALSAFPTQFRVGVGLGVN
jgi:AGZA family xanthine/uracil permease-like MFS transporter